MTWHVMAQTEHPVVVLLKIVVIQFMLPGSSYSGIYTVYEKT